LDPTVAATARKSAIALVPTPTTEQKVRQLGAKRTILVPQMALPSAELAKFRDFPIHQNRTQVRFLSMGRILGWKGLRLAVQAFAKLVQRYPNAEYWHDGDGEMGAELVTLAQELGIADKFRLIEGNTRSQALENLANADVVLFPCLHDEPGWVVVEAMAAARPVIYVMGRPATPGAEETGVSSNATTAEQAVEDLANAMFRLANDPALRRQMGEAARAHAWQYFNYEARGVLYSNLIHEVVTTHRSKAKKPSM
jgi:glycosyltransferase involved in cell wall biosynthesis